MPPPHCRRTARLSLLAALALPFIAGCSSIGDFDRLQQPIVSDDTHAWVGREAAARAGAPISLYNLTEEERALRDLAFPLIEPSYDRQRWDAVVYEYGTKRKFQRELWVFDITAYYQHLQAAGYRSTTGRYNKLIDDIRNDVIRIAPFFDVAHRVVDLDRRRDESMNHIASLAPPDRANALARVSENTLTIAWVQHSLAQRCASYRFALEHLVVAEPEKVAADAEVALTQLQQKIAANQVVATPVFASASLDIAAR